MEISYKLDHFEGPLDLLLHLIEKNKVNIYDIPIVEITKQYLDYMNHMEKEDLNIVSKFLVMAATLIDIKSRMLLPPEKDEDGVVEDPRAELVGRLLEYRLYKYMALELRDREIGAERFLYKIPTVPQEVAKYEPPVDLDGLLGDLSLAKLSDIFLSVMRRSRDRIDPVRSQFGTIQKDHVSLEERIGSVMEYANSHGRFSFRAILCSGRNREEIVVTFLALLELMKLGRVRLSQERLFDDMIIEVSERGGEANE